MGNTKNIAFWVVLFLLILALFNLFHSGNQSTMAARSLSYSDFVTRWWTTARWRRSRSTANACASRGVDGNAVHHTVQPRSANISTEG